MFQIGRKEYHAYMEGTEIYDSSIEDASVCAMQFVGQG